MNYYRGTHFNIDQDPEINWIFDKGWAESTWKNDACPSVELEMPESGIFIKIWIDDADDEKREFRGDKRFLLGVYDDDTGESIAPIGRELYDFIDKDDDLKALYERIDLKEIGDKYFTEHENTFRR